MAAKLLAILQTSKVEGIAIVPFLSHNLVRGHSRHNKVAVATQHA